MVMGQFRYCSQHNPTRHVLVGGRDAELAHFREAQNMGEPEWPLRFSAFRQQGPELSGQSGLVHVDAVNVVCR